MSVGIICEFNPFHSGHKYIIDKVRTLDEDVICVMSGPFVQRGEVACASKYARAKEALRCGASAVVELPVRFALSAAKNFALGGVETLKHISGITALAFGTECEPELLYEIAEVKCRKTTDEAIKEELSCGVSYPTAVANALGKINAEYKNALLPNNILALEYLSALEGTGIAPMPVKRTGCGYNDLGLSGEYASATAIRSALKDGKDCSRFLSGSMLGDIKFADEDLLDKLSQYALLRLDVDRLRMLHDVETGFEFALYKAVRSGDMKTTIETLKSKRYTYARLRRMILCALLGITSTLDLDIKTRVLGIRKSFRSKLSCFDDSFILRNSDITTELACDKNLVTDCLAQDIYALLTGGKPNEYYSVPILVVSD